MDINILIATLFVELAIIIVKGTNISVTVQKNG